MRRGFLAILTAMVMVSAAVLGGCAAVGDGVDPKPGPEINSGLASVMPTVEDQRTWPELASGDPSMNVRLFNPALTDTLRQDLLQTGLFESLPMPGQPQAKATPYTFKIVLTDFRIAKLGSNAWLVPHQLINGVALPVFAVFTVASGGEDMGAYAVPSSEVGTYIVASTTFSQEGMDVPILERGYNVRVDLGGVSERDLTDDKGYGIEVGKAHGPASLKALAQVIAQDQRWAYLDSYKSLALGRQVLDHAEDATPAQKLAAATDLLALLREPAYMPNEVQILHDPLLDAEVRAKVFNETRAMNLGLKENEALPTSQAMDAAEAAKLYDSPELWRSLVVAEIDQAVLGEAADLLQPAVPAGATMESNQTGMPTGRARPAVRMAPVMPSQPQPAAADEAAPAEAVPESPEVIEMRRVLGDRLAAALQGKPLLQKMLLSQADKAVGKAWKPMESVLTRLESPSVATYLEQRNK